MLHVSLLLGGKTKNENPLLQAIHSVCLFRDAVQETVKISLSAMPNLMVTFVVVAHWKLDRDHQLISHRVWTDGRLSKLDRSFCWLACTCTDVLPPTTGHGNLPIFSNETQESPELGFWGVFWAIYLYHISVPNHRHSTTFLRNEGQQESLKSAKQT